MSEVVKVALVAEGITDYEVIKASIESMLNGRAFDVKLLQPEESVAFGAGNAGSLGGGWRGVYKWCNQAMSRCGGIISDDVVFMAYDLLLIHLDVDVSGEDPANDRYSPIPELKGVLPCRKSGNTPQQDAKLLRDVLLSWIGQTEKPSKVVLCTPCMSTETWVMAVYFPNDSQMNSKGWENHENPEGRLGAQPARSRFKKSHKDYSLRYGSFVSGWPRVVERLTEAARYNKDFLESL